MKTNTSARLKEIMKIRNLKQIDILSKCAANPYGGKISKSDLSQYVSGKVLPRQDKLSILAYALNVSEAWLMGYDVPMEINDDPNLNDDIKKKKISYIITLLSSIDNDKLSHIYELLDLIKDSDNEVLIQLKQYTLFLKSQVNN